MVELFANSGDPDQTPHSAMSDLGLHCLPVTDLGSPVFNGLKPIASPCTCTCETLLNDACLRSAQKCFQGELLVQIVTSYSSAMIFLTFPMKTVVRTQKLCI